MNLKFRTILEKFAKKGEKTSWTYILIDAKQANKINPKVHTSYRVKGSIDQLLIEQVAIMPMGDGTFVLPVNHTMRKALQKQVGDEVQLVLALDTSEKLITQELLDCLELDIKAKDFFETLSKSHQRYFSKWIEDAKTAVTKEKRLLCVIESLSNKWDYPSMIKFYKK